MAYLSAISPKDVLSMKGAGHGFDVTKKTHLIFSDKVLEGIETVHVGKRRGSALFRELEKDAISLDKAQRKLEMKKLDVENVSQLIKNEEARLENLSGITVVSFFLGLFSVIETLVAIGTPNASAIPLANLAICAAIAVVSLVHGANVSDRLRKLKDSIDC